MAQKPWEKNWSQADQASGKKPWEKNWDQSADPAQAEPPKMSAGTATYADALTREGEANSASTQAREWLMNLKSDIDEVLKGGAARNPMFGPAMASLFERLSRPVENAVNRFFDPTGALGGSVTNLERDRPMVNDPGAQAATSIVGGMALGGMQPIRTGVGAVLNAMKSGEAAPAAAQAAQAPAKMTYQQAKEILANAPIASTERNLANAEARAGLAAQIRNERAGLQAQNIEQTAQQTAPMVGEQEALRNARIRARAGLQVERGAAEKSHTLLPKELRAEKAETIAAARQQANQQAAEFAQTIGRDINKGAMAGQAREARLTAWKQYQDRIGGIYDRIREIFAIPENGSEILPAGADAPQFFSSPVDLTGGKGNLQEAYSRLKAELAVARSQNSPGARLVMEYFDGPDIIDGKTAIDNLKAANAIGYGPGDYTLSTESRALAKQVAAEYRTALNDSVGKLAVGRDEARGLFESAKAELAKRDSLFKTRAARSTAASMERYGDAGRMINDPAGFQAWWKQISVDPEVQSAAKRQVIEKLLGKDSKEFARNWRNLSPEVKQMVFTTDEIARGDAVASNQREAIEKILKEFSEREKALNAQMAQETISIRNRRAELSQLQSNINELSAKIREAKDVQRAQMVRERARIQQRADSLKALLRSAEAAKRIEYLKQIRAAREKVEQVQRLKKLGWIAATGAGLTYVGRHTIESVFGALGGFGGR